MNRTLDLVTHTAAAEALRAVAPARIRRLAFALLIALGLFALLAFRQYGISNDEEVQHTYGRMLLDFYI